MTAYITVIGAGAWGTALAQALARAGHWVCLYTHEESVAAQINQTHSNTTYLPGISLLPTILATTDARRAASATTIFVAVPVPYLRTTLVPFRGLITAEHVFISLSKGIEEGSLKLPTQLILETLGQCQIGVLGGPNIAAEVARGAHSGMVVAASHPRITALVADLLRSPELAISQSFDPIGVQVCGAVKNVIAIGLGIASAASGSQNTVAYLLTRGLGEMAKLSSAVGGVRATAYGVAGIGDLVVSSVGGQARNFKLGQLIGQGQSLSDAAAAFSSPPEGVATTRSINLLCEQYGLDLLLCQKVYQILYGQAACNILWT